MKDKKLRNNLFELINQWKEMELLYSLPADSNSDIRSTYAECVQELNEILDGNLESIELITPVKRKPWYKTRRMK